MICLNSSQVPKGIKNSMEMSLLQVSPRSFNIHLASPEVTQLDLFDHSDCGDAVEKFFELLNAENNQEKLKKLLGQLKLRVTFEFERGFVVVRFIARLGSRTGNEWSPYYK